MEQEFENYLKDVGNEVIDNLFIENNGYSLEIVNFISDSIEKSENGIWEIVVLNSPENAENDNDFDVKKSTLSKYEPFIFYEEDELTAIYKCLTDGYIKENRYSVILWVNRKNNLVIRGYLITDREIKALTAEKLSENNHIIENILETYDKSIFYIDANPYEKTTDGNYKKLDAH